MRGHIRKQGEKWYVIVDLPRDPVTGKRRQKWHSGFKTRKEAQKGLTEILSRLDRGTYVERTKQTLSSYLDEWFEATSSTRHASTNVTYKSIIASHLTPNIGSLPLQAITGATLNTLYAHLGKDGLSPATVRYVHAVIRKALKDAQRWNLVTRNAADAADPPRVARTQVRTWSGREVRAFLSQVEDDRLYAAFVLACTTGMRRGEVLGLRWRDVDLETGRVSISQTLVVVNRSVEFSEPKTARGRRMVALDATTTEALREHRDQQILERSLMGDGYEDADLVFANEDGTPLNPDSFSDAFWRHVRAASLPRIRFHDLRHTHATLALSAGIHPKVVSERLGHASVAFTLDTYSHAIPAMQETAADLVASLVFGQLGGLGEIPGAEPPCREGEEDRTQHSTGIGDDRRPSAARKIAPWAYVQEQDKGECGRQTNEVAGQGRQRNQPATRSRTERHQENRSGRDGGGNENRRNPVHASELSALSRERNGPRSAGRLLVASVVFDRLRASGETRISPTSPARAEELDLDDQANHGPDQRNDDHEEEREQEEDKRQRVPRGRGVMAGARAEDRYGRQPDPSNCCESREDESYAHHVLSVLGERTRT